MADAKTVTGSGLSLSGADAGNYTVNTTAATTANITPLALTGNITAANKVYDGSTAAAILTRTLSTPIAGDSVSYSGGTALFGDKNVADAKIVTGSGLSLSGADAGNYTVNTTAATTANITPLPGVTPPPVVTPPVVIPPVVSPPVVTPPVITPPVVTPPVVTPPVVIPPVVSPPVVTPPVITPPVATQSAPLAVQMPPAFGFSSAVGAPRFTVLAGGVRMPLPPAPTVLPEAYVPPVYPPKQDRY